MIPTSDQHARHAVLAASRRFAIVCLWAAWLMFVVSFFLPATNVVAMSGSRGGSALTGWQAFKASMLVLAGTAQQPVILLANPGIIFFAAFPFMNATMLLAPGASFAGRWAATLALILVPAGLLPLLLPVAIRGDVYFGFYLWNASFFLMSAGCILTSAACWAGVARGRLVAPACGVVT